MNFFETNESYILELAVPGFTPDQLDIEIEGRSLLIRAESQGESREGRRYWLRGLPRRRLARRFRLPARADAEAATAAVSNGLLTLTFPKVAGAGLKVQVAAA